MSRTVAKNLAREIEDHLSGDSKDQSTAARLISNVGGVGLLRNPSEADLPAEQLRTTLRFWQSLPKVQGIPNAVKIDPEKLLSVLGYLMLIDIDKKNDDFRYSVYGTKIAEVTGFDMTGKSVWDIATTSSIQVFFAACYMAAEAMRCPLYTVHEPPREITVNHWHRLILPLGLNGEIKRFLVCNMPIVSNELR